MTADLKRRLLWFHLFFVLIAFSYIHYNLSGPDLIWNMILALVAIDSAFLAIFFKNKVLVTLALLGWFFFYPNTFYMLTDVVHMSFASSILTDKLSMVTFFIYMASILLAICAGVMSIFIVFHRLNINHWFVRYLSFGFISFVASLAIHLGRYARLNSWNVLTHPQVVWDEILAVFSYSEIHFVLGFTFVQIMCLILLDQRFIKK